MKLYSRGTVFFSLLNCLLRIRLKHHNPLLSYVWERKYTAHVQCIVQCTYFEMRFWGETSLLCTVHFFWDEILRWDIFVYSTLFEVRHPCCVQYTFFEMRFWGETFLLCTVHFFWDEILRWDPCCVQYTFFEMRFWGETFLSIVHFLRWDFEARHPCCVQYTFFEMRFWGETSLLCTVHFIITLFDVDNVLLCVCYVAPCRLMLYHLIIAYTF
jgi:hypothetical protein